MESLSQKHRLHSLMIDLNVLTPSGEALSGSLVEALEGCDIMQSVIPSVFFSVSFNFSAGHKSEYVREKLVNWVIGDTG